MNQFGLNSRRSFLKGALLATASGAAIASAANADQGSKRLWTMVIDLNKCIGCQSCTMACKAESGASPGIFYTRVLVDDSSPSGKIFFLPAQCRHCGQPACLPVCASGAIVKQADGIVVTDWDACGGDGACVRACPH